MRENDTILIADMCHNDSASAGVPKYFTNKANLSKDASIDVTKSGRIFTVNDIIIHQVLSSL